MSNPPVFLFDVDNTLLDNDRIIADLRELLRSEFGAASAGEYWRLSEALRDELGYVDYLGALNRYRATLDHGGADDHKLLSIASFLIDYPFADRVYPGALEVLARFAEFGTTAILSDGDVVFQPRKLKRAGLWDAVGGRVLIYIHKELVLDQMQHHYPADRYVMVDDKPRILTAMKGTMGERLATVFPRQGHYANDPANATLYPAADFTVEHIADLLTLDVGALLDSQSQEKPT